MPIQQNLQTLSVLNDYPEKQRGCLLHLRTLIIETVAENEHLSPVTETLKWGEASYVRKQGSTLRIGAKKSTPDEYALYFNCQSKLINTFKKLYPKTFKYQGNRAIVFKISDAVPTTEIKHCILLSLAYHQLKNKPPFTKR